MFRYSHRVRGRTRALIDYAAIACAGIAGALAQTVTRRIYTFDVEGLIESELDQGANFIIMLPKRKPLGPTFP